MNNFIKIECWRSVWLLLAGLIFGYFIDHIWIGLLLGLLGLLIWHGIQLRHLYGWLQNRKQYDLPLPDGIWGVIFSILGKKYRASRKRKKRMHELVDNFRNAAAAMPDAVLVFAHSYEILWFNSAAKGLFGLKYPADINLSLASIVREPAFIDVLENQEYSKPFFVTAPVDETVKLRVHVVPYEGDRLLLVARDVSDVQRLEQVRKDFVANVSHELRSPLTVIMGDLENMLESSGNDKKVRKPIRRMYEQSQRMQAIVEDLLTISALENSDAVSDENIILVSEMLDQIVNDAQRMSAGKHQFVTSFENSVNLLGNYKQLYSVFSNLIFNSVQYMPNEGVIDISWNKSTLEEGVFSIRDSGLGIDEAHINRITERFYRVDKARSRSQGGTGLGLSIVKHVLIQHEATLEIESTLGEGSVFRCIFPSSRLALENDIKN